MTEGCDLQSLTGRCTDPAHDHGKTAERWRLLADVGAEMGAQDAQWGEQNHPDGTGGDAALLGRSMLWLRDTMRRACQDAAKRGECTWLLVALEEVFEAAAETDPVALRTEVVQAAAVFTQWAGAIDRASRPPAAAILASVVGVRRAGHKVAPLDGTQDGWRCSCGRTFTVETGFAVCPEAGL